MRKLKLNYVNDETIAGIASSVDNIEELKIDGYQVTMHGWEILSTAINNRPTPVSRQKSLLVINRICFYIIQQILETILRTVYEL